MGVAESSRAAWACLAVGWGRDTAPRWASCGALIRKRPIPPSQVRISVLGDALVSTASGSGGPAFERAGTAFGWPGAMTDVRVARCLLAEKHLQC